MTLRLWNTQSREDPSRRLPAAGLEPCRPGCRPDRHQPPEKGYRADAPCDHTRPDHLLLEPSGNRIEVYASGYTASPDNPQRVWDSDHLGRGLFYYEGEMIPSFLEIVT
jgi:hypothetical protein